jgi:hypothetical protein
MKQKYKYCHFCGKNESLHPIPNERKWVCSMCWEIIAYIASKWYAAGANLLGGEEKDGADN